MFNFSFILYRFRRRLVYPLLSIFVVLALWLGTPAVSQAFSIFDLLIRGVQIIQLSNISDTQEVQLGKQINQQLVSREVRLYRNSDVNRYINQIGQRLVPASDRSGIPYTFQVVDDNGINAFATMGGFVYLNTGLIRLAENEAQLASVMAHEIGHIASRHAIQQMRQTAIASGVASVAGLDRNRAIQIGVDLALRRPNSREDEFEADQRGLANSIRAGYPPSATVAFMEKLLRQNGRSVPTFLSTHPATGDRITRLRSAINTQTANVGDGLDSAAYRARIRPLL
ncbi:M48 family metalloprotease [Gloeocapsopsis crepidinum LEGE 06123]|uniref:M48 family metalloprotease n=1 Tax=Gloeocapsopsis crepidinum LEGE 06123 TaxID=588587 RepID=A0ABR9UM43_9CHRO|nr:M48 family metallopeptidase [Gloeocapsopsis crepidinum]MBE9189346.1 M48 family metalloprotease [Gloeocapsopsis crepidinum LEGE 06123]